MAEENALIGEKFVGDPVEIGTSAERYKNYLTENEEVHLEYKGIRDSAVFTNKRLMILDPQGLRGKKVEVVSIPWKSVSGYSVENSGTFDLDAELKVCGSGIGIIKLSFSKGVYMTDICQFINKKVL